ncbi:hypothetical protein MKZ38_006403 [Zalerion maritima]|uniref:Uncharacterized protein n=1 Tax=Zalerion maritima TaxID=339359 RepID=A0AAD5RJX7_9PEZI|nr:hypothetical protein MKZ38_006403 [Zalerion maritima]
MEEPLKKASKAGDSIVDECEVGNSGGIDLGKRQDAENARLYGDGDPRMRDDDNTNKCPNRAKSAENVENAQSTSSGFRERPIDR